MTVSRSSSATKTRLFWNVVSNYAGRAAVAGANLIFAPIYVHLLGAEAFGLVGVFTTLQSTLSLLDFGLTATATREVARASAVQTSSKALPDLIRTLEVCYWGIASLLMLALLGASHVIATRWLHSETLAPDVIHKSFVLIAISVVIFWPVSFYSGCMMGLEKQPLYNTLLVAATVVRLGGATIILIASHGSVIAFFLWQVVTAIAQVALLAYAVWTAPPMRSFRGRARIEVLTRVAPFMFRMGLVYASILLVTQVDKFVITKLVSLSQFGYYSLAWTAINALYLFYSPLCSALFPHLANTVARGDLVGAGVIYRKGCDLVAIGVIPCAMLLSIYSREILSLWLGNNDTAINTAPVLAILAPFGALSAMIYLPSLYLWAHGTTKPSVVTNTAVGLLLLPAVFVGASTAGLRGAAWACGIARAVQFVWQSEWMSRTSLAGVRHRSYLGSVAIPFISSCAAIFACRASGLVTSDGGFVLAVGIGLTWLAALVVTAYSTPTGRAYCVLLIRAVVGARPRLKRA